MRLTDDAMQSDLEGLRDIELDELSVRRVRDRLRTWANDRRYMIAAEDRWRIRIMAAGFVVLVVTLGVGIWQRKHESLPGPVPAPTVVVEPMSKLDLAADKLRLELRLSGPVEPSQVAPVQERRHLASPPVATVRHEPAVDAPPVAAAAVPDVEREDALYLSLIHALRAGHTDEARDLGLEYLRAFPDGFRRAEVVRLVSHASN